MDANEGSPSIIAKLFRKLMNRGVAEWNRRRGGWPQRVSTSKPPHAGERSGGRLPMTSACGSTRRVSEGGGHVMFDLFYVSWDHYMSRHFGAKLGTLTVSPMRYGASQDSTARLGKRGARLASSPRPLSRG